MLHLLPGNERRTPQPDDGANDSKIGSWLRWRFDPEPDVCPTAAITEQELAWPRIVRRAFSDPIVPHESTGVHGRGTEEVKTNDVTNRVGQDDAGFTVEFGRPTVGVRFWQIQEMTTALARMGIEFEKRNPVTSLMADTKTGEIRSDILNEKILSAIVEFKTTLDNAPAVLQKIKEVAKTLDTIVAVGARRVAMNKARTGWKSYYSAKDSPSTEARPISVWGVRPWRLRKPAPLLVENSPKPTNFSLSLVSGRAKFRK